MTKLKDITKETIITILDNIDKIINKHIILINNCNNKQNKQKYYNKN
jgi:hypothetical protein